MSNEVTIEDARRILIASRTSQDRLQGIYGQEDQIAAWAEANGYVVVGYLRENGIPGDTPLTERHNLQAGIKAIADGHAHLIAWRDYSRIARVENLEPILQQIWDAGGNALTHKYGPVHQDKPGDDTHAELRRVYARRDVDELATIRRRRKDGKRWKLERHGYVGGTRFNGRPYGREIVQFQDRYEYRPIPHEQAIIREMIAHCPNDQGYAAEAARLNALGVPTVTGAPWTGKVVRGIVRRGAVNLRPLAATRARNGGTGVLWLAEAG